MNSKPPPPDIVIGRLPIYLRALAKFAGEKKVITSSKELGERLGISSAQIRKDLSHFGDFGKQGTGYNVTYLLGQLQEILNLHRRWQVIIVGSGHVGRALANYEGFKEHGFDVVGIFDNDPKKIGLTFNNLTVQDYRKAAETVRELNVKIAMLATPAEAAQQNADVLISAGITAILCYAPVTLNVPSTVKIEYIDPVIQLQRMTYYLD